MIALRERITPLSFSTNKKIKADTKFKNPKLTLTLNLVCYFCSTVLKPKNK